MVLLKRISLAQCAVLAGFGIACLLGCERDFSTPLLTAPSDSTAVPAQKPDTAKPKPDPDPDPDPVVSRPVLIESLAAGDLRLTVGQTKPAPVTVLPANATSPLYEMTSSKPGVAEVTPDGIRGAGAGSATITVHALDGSEKTTKFHVVVDALFQICLLPCLCLGKTAADDGNGKDKDKGKEQDQADPDCGD